MSEIEKAKATCARLKGHFTRAKNSLSMKLEARNGLHIIEKAYEEAIARLQKVESHLMEMENLDGIDEEWISCEFQGVEECNKALIEMSSQQEGSVMDDVFRGVNENLPGTGVNRIPKQNFKKPNELEEHATLKDFEEWKCKILDYYTLTGIDKCDEKVKVT